MKLLPFVVFCAFNLCFVPLSHCFFLSNPLNWLRFGSTDSTDLQNQIESNGPNVSSLESTDSSTATTPPPAPSISIHMPPAQLRPLQIIQAVEPIRSMPLSPSRQGVPIKINRFGLEPLPYQLKPIPQRFPIHSSQHMPSDQTFNRRYGHLKEETTVYPSPEPTQRAANEKAMPAKEYFTTFGSIEESNTDAAMKLNLKEYETSDELSEENLENSSPTPVYISSGTISPKVIPSRSTTMKPLYLHRPDFASELNNMYYNKPEVFQPMMDKFEAKDKL